MLRRCFCTVCYITAWNSTSHKVPAILHFQFKFLVVHLKGSTMVAQYLAPAIKVGNLGGVPGCHLQPGPDLDAVVTSGE